MIRAAKPIDLDLDLPKRLRPSFAGVVTTVFDALVRRWRNRKVLNHLAEFDDVHLADIGLCREDIERIRASSGFADDPSCRLSDIARTRARRALRPHR